MDPSEVVKRYTDAIDQKTLVLVDTTFLHEECAYARKEYRRIYDGSNEDFPKKEFPAGINLNHLWDAVCQLAHVNRNSALMMLSIEPGWGNIFKNTLVEDVQYRYRRYELPYDMREFILRNPQYRRIVFFAENEGYKPLIRALEKRGDLIFLIKARLPTLNGVASEFQHIPYQFSDYVAGMTLGLSLEEL